MRRATARRRGTARRAASWDLLDRIPVRQVFPLWRRDRARGRNPRITAEQPSREVTRPDEVETGKGRGGEFLPITGHIYCIRVVPIDRNRKMNASLSARVEPHDYANRNAIRIQRLLQSLR